MVKNFSTGLANALVIIGILGLAFIGLGEFFDFPVISKAIILIVLGIGLLIEGNIRAVLGFTKGGLSTIEIAHILTVFIGFLLIFAGITFIMPNADTFKQTRLWAVGIGLIVVLAQRFIPQKG